MKRVTVVLSVVSALMSAGNALVLWDQSSALSSTGVVAQDFPDFPAYSTQEFDDFVVSAPGWFITRITIYGIERGNPALNQSLEIRIQSSLGVGGWATNIPVTNATYSNGNLIFDVTPTFQLAPGTYWISAWIKRPFGGGGGQWFWLRNGSSNGSEHYFHNPGGGFGAGTSPIPGSQVFGSPSDLGFTIEGELVPEPASMVALGSGLISLLALRRRRRA